MRNKIKCTVGMLGWNSGDVIERALKSVSSFEEIILADGGSTDDTVSIAKKYGVKVIQQSNPGNPIKDFSKERNILLNAATQPWFLWIDPDEYISKELSNEIFKMINDANNSCMVYNLQIARVNPVTLVPYIDLRPNYQIRLFSTEIGGYFHKKIHEKFYFDKDKYKVCKLNGLWYTPIDKMDFSKHKKVVDVRFSILVRDNPPRSFIQYINKAILKPLISIFKIFIRIVLLRLLHPFGNVVPLSLERNRAYTQYVLFRENTRVFFGK